MAIKHKGLVFVLKIHRHLLKNLCSKKLKGSCKMRTNYACLCVVKSQLVFENRCQIFIQHVYQMKQQRNGEYVNERERTG